VAPSTGKFDGHCADVGRTPIRALSDRETGKSHVRIAQARARRSNSPLSHIIRCILLLSDNIGGEAGPEQGMRSVRCAASSRQSPDIFGHGVTRHVNRYIAAADHAHRPPFRSEATQRKHRDGNSVGAFLPRC
jgi:hypothetical protein